MKRLLILAILLILTACAAPVTATPTVVLSNTPQLTGISATTPIPTITPSPTISPSTTEIQSPPDFLALPIVSNLLLPPTDDPDCSLPCWEGLRIGKSTQSDVQLMFDHTFEFSGMIDFFEGVPHLAPVWISNVVGTQTDGYEWEFPGGQFVIATVVDKSTDTLTGIRHVYRTNGVYRLYTVQQIIQEYGPPDYYYSYAPFTPSLVENSAYVDVVLFYKEGMVFSLASEAFVYQLTADDQTESFLNYCLHEPPIRGQAYITAPFDSLDPEQLDPLQREWFEIFVDRPDLWESGEELFGLTTEEYAKVAMQDSPCFLYK